MKYKANIKDGEKRKVRNDSITVVVFRKKRRFPSKARDTHTEN